MFKLVCKVRGHRLVTLNNGRTYGMDYAAGKEYIVLVERTQQVCVRCRKTWPEVVEVIDIHDYGSGSIEYGEAEVREMPQTSSRRQSIHHRGIGSG